MGLGLRVGVEVRAWLGDVVCMVKNEVGEGEPSLSVPRGEGGLEVGWDSWCDLRDSRIIFLGVAEELPPGEVCGVLVEAACHWSVWKV